MAILDEINAVETAHATLRQEIVKAVSDAHAALDKIAGPTVSTVEGFMAKAENWIKSEGKYAETELEDALSRLKSFL